MRHALITACLLRAHLFVAAQSPTTIARETEVANAQYNLFLTSLEEQCRLDLFRRCTYDLTGYDKSCPDLFQ